MAAQEPSFRSILGKLGYVQDSTVAPLPAWARFYLDLGASIAAEPATGAYFVVAISAPTRSFAASLIACGVVLASASRQSDGATVEHIEKLLSVEPGKPVILRSGRRQLKGHYLGAKDIVGSQTMRGTWLVIRTDEGTERYVPLENAAKIEVLDEDSIRLPRSQRGHLIEPPGPLLAAVADEVLVATLLTRSETDCVLVDSAAAVAKVELTAAEFAIRGAAGDYTIGTLQELLRARPYLKRGTAYRAHVLSAGSRYIPAFASRLEPLAALFDGGLAYVKWAEFWKRTHRILVLDRTDRRFEDAVRLVNQEYVERRIDRNLDCPLPDPPRGVELMVFEVYE